MSFTTYLDNYDAPFLFIDPYCDTEDVTTLSHEFGHYLDAYVNYNAYESLDLSECFSQAMEYIMLDRCAMQDGDEQAALRLIKLLDTLDLYVTQASFAEFESRVYAMDEDELDADALNLLARHRAIRPGKAAVMTPHPGEAARLLDCPVTAVTADPLSALARLQQLAPYALLKGARTLMTDGAHTAVNRFGTPAMAKGGSGDVLTGILTGLLAQHLPVTTLETIQLAALIHGLAGIRAGRIQGEGCVTPDALINCIRLDVKRL